MSSSISYNLKISGNTQENLVHNIYNIKTSERASLKKLIQQRKSRCKLEQLCNFPIFIKKKTLCSKNVIMYCIWCCIFYVVLCSKEK